MEGALAARMLGNPLDWTETTLKQRFEWMIEHLAGGNGRLLARKADVSETQPTQITSEQQTGMHPKTAAKYAKAWGVDVNWILYGTGAGPTMATMVVEPAELEHVDDPNASGRWKRYAARYWTFRAEATLARARNVPEAALDAAADRLGAQHGDGPSEAEAFAAIEHYARRLEPKTIEAGRDVEESDLTVTPVPKKRRGR